MTTIATDGKTIASDRLVTGDGVQHCNITKIRRFDNGDIMGLTGTAFDMDTFADWYISDRSELPDLSNHTEVLVLEHTGTIRCFNQRGHSFIHDAPAALGSGAALAYGAMAAGASPAEAVRIASERDIYSGGGVDVLP